MVLSTNTYYHGTDTNGYNHGNEYQQLQSWYYGPMITIMVLSTKDYNHAIEYQHALTIMVLRTNDYNHGIEYQ